jgi:multidrug resistance efflux pump
MRNEAEAAEKKLDKRDDAQLAYARRQLKIAEAEATLRKATLKTDAPADLVGSIQQREVQYDEKAARLALDAARQHAAQVQRSNAEEIQRLTDKASYARGRVAELQRAIATMQVTAVRAGTIVYSAGENGEKKKVGDNVWRGEDLMQIVGLGKMLGDGQVDEVDMARLAEHQPAVLRLDAMPDVQLRGSVASIARSVSAKSQTDASKIVKLKIAIDPTKVALRPGMRFPRPGRDRAPARRGPGPGRRRVRHARRAGRLSQDRRWLRARPARARPADRDDDRGQVRPGAGRPRVAQRSGGGAVKRAAIAIAVVAALGVTGAWMLRGAGARGDDVATYTVGKQHFVRRVTAGGQPARGEGQPARGAEARRSQNGPLKIPWRARRHVWSKKGEVVMRFDPSEARSSARQPGRSRRPPRPGSAGRPSESNTAVAGRNTRRRAGPRRARADAQVPVEGSDDLLAQPDHRVRDRRAPRVGQAVARRDREADRAAPGALERGGDRCRAPESRARDRARPGRAERHGDRRAVRRHLRARAQLERLAAQARRLAVAGPGRRRDPALDAMEANVYVLEVDGSGLAEGQPAEVVVEARPDRTFAAKIKVVDKLAQPRQQGSPVQYFGVTIALDTSDRELMKPGQRVRAGLVLDQQDALVVPRKWSRHSKSRLQIAAPPASRAGRGRSRRRDLGRVASPGLARAT